MPVESIYTHAFDNQFEESLNEHLVQGLRNAVGDYTVLGPVNIGGRQIDGVILSPYCIFTIEAKNIKGRITKGLNTPLQAYDSFGRLIEYNRHEEPDEQATKHWKALSSFLSDALGDIGAWYKAFLVFNSGTTFEVDPRETRDPGENPASPFPFIVSLDEILGFIQRFNPPRKVLLTRPIQNIIAKVIKYGPGHLTPEEKVTVANLIYAQNTKKNQGEKQNQAPYPPPKPTLPYYPPTPTSYTPSYRPAQQDETPKKPWYRSGWFYFVIFFFFPPLWAILTLTEKDKGCFPKIIAGIYLILTASLFFISYLLASTALKNPSRFEKILEPFISNNVNLETPLVTESTLETPFMGVNPTSDKGKSISNEATATPSKIISCKIIWAEYQKNDLANKNRSMVWDEIVSVQVAGSGMTAKQFYNLILEKNPVLKDDGNVFLKGKTYYLPKCENYP